MNDLMEKIVSLCKRRGFVYPGSEIYGGLASTYDFGPLGVELKNNIKKLWWKYFVQDREDMVGLDGGILLSPRIWEVSGHVKNFKDALVECKKCHLRFRSDKLKDASKCPECGGGFTERKMFSGLFKTTIGAVAKEGVETYLRPETAQAIFVDYKSVLDSTNKKIPFGVGQIGKAFRNEITTGNFIFRILEFDLAEIEYFIASDSDWNKIFEAWLEYMYGFADLIGLKRKDFYNHEIPAKERAFYSQRTVDIEYQFPFGQDELWAIAYRTDYDLAAHQQASLLTATLRRRLAGKPLRPFIYRDFGSLVSLGDYSTVGSLMGALIGGSLFIEGLFARLMYVSLYRMHLYALHGFARVFFDTLARMITRRTEPRVKLH